MDRQELQLQDIHVPDPIGWWPPAPGWWLFTLAVLLVCAGIVWLWRRWRRETVRKQALQLLSQLEQDVDQTALEQIQALSTLLRRVCISCFPRSDVASLTGENWLQFLDQQWDRKLFTEGAGRCLLEAPYRRETDYDSQRLFELCREWITALPDPHSKQPLKHD